MFFRKALCWHNIDIFKQKGVVISRDYVEAIKDETCRMRSSLQDYIESSLILQYNRN